MTFSGGKWYCSVKCHNVGEKCEIDCLRNYSIATTWFGLMDLAHRDVIREADGLAMMAMWRINMWRFWNGGHYKYFTLSHRLLAGMKTYIFNDVYMYNFNCQLYTFRKKIKLHVAGISGCFEPRIIHDIVHNRTANLKGGVGHNIAMDRVCEFYNAEFKGAVL